MFDNKENRNIAPTPLGYLVNMEILIFKFEGPISNNKENRNLPPPPGTPLAIFFFELLRSIWKY